MSNEQTAPSKRKVGFPEDAFEGEYHVKVVIQGKDGEKFHFIFPGAPLKVEGFEEFDFFLHKAMDFTDDWVVSEKGSGMSVARGPSRARALELLLERLEALTPEMIREKLAQVAKG